MHSGASFLLYVIPANWGLSDVGDSGFEPLTTSASMKYDTLLEVSATCKIAANQHICALAHFPAFQDIHSGCCTVAAQM
jgi:hypothetical protein